MLKTLEGKRIILAVTGSLAAVKTVELAHSLRRRGCEVVAVMSQSARRIIHPDALYAACETKPILNFRGAEHISLVERSDLLLIAPCTANTIAKICYGVCDTAVSLIACCAMGKIPVILAPAMHLSMYESPSIKEALAKLRQRNVIIADPRIEEGKAKIAPIDDIVLLVERELSDGILRGKKVIVTAGPTYEEIDPVRILTTKSSGKMGVEIAKEAFRQGAEVTLVHAGGCAPGVINRVIARSAREMTEKVLEMVEDHDVLISAAAISDFYVEKSPTKLTSSHEQVLRLVPAEKMIAKARQKSDKLKIVAFKAETNVGVDELLNRARKLKDEVGAQIVVANDVGRGGIGEDENEVFIVGDSVTHVRGHKSVIAREIIRHVSCL